MAKKPRKVGKKVLIGITFLLLGLASFGGYTLTHQKEAVAQETIKENIVQRGDLSVSVEGDGQAQFVTRDLAFEVSGRVSTVMVQTSGQVKKGDVLATLDASSFNDAVQEAAASYELANIKLETSKKSQESSLLDAEQSVSDLENELAVMHDFPELYTAVEIQNIENDLANAQRSLLDAQNSTSVRESELSVEQAARTLKKAQEDAGKVRLVAPADGTILNVSIREDDSVGTSAAMVFSYDEVYIESSIQEYDIGSIKVGQNVSVEFDAIENKTYRAQVSEISLVPVTESGVSSYTVKASLSDPDDSVLPGMACSLAFIEEEVSGVLIVPVKAVKVVDGQQMVEMYDAEHSVITQAVETEFSDGTNTEIISGLQEGDIVLTRSVSTTPSSAQEESNSDETRALGSSGGMGGGMGGGQGGGPGFIPSGPPGG